MQEDDDDAAMRTTRTRLKTASRALRAPAAALKLAFLVLVGVPLLSVASAAPARCRPDATIPAPTTASTLTTSSKLQVLWGARPDNGHGVALARARPRRAAAPPRKKALGRQQQQQQQQQQQALADGLVPHTANVEQPQHTGRTIKNVTAQNGQSVLLHCLVEPNGSGDVPSVSWFRGTGELQLLTYEQTTIIQDERFVVWHGTQRENDWALQIKNLDRNSDAGLYQCQTTSGSESPQSHFYQLNIVEPQVSIVGAPDLAVKLGAPINLNCVISHTADQMQFIFWYRNERMINYDIANEKRGKVVMSKSQNASSKQDTITSSLQIYSSKLSDSGNYTCQPSGTRSASVYLHVLEAHDKRLIMFQNDDQSIAASSQQQQQQQQQASSAVSARAGQGQAYSLFVAFVVLCAWWQLVAQAQTGVSLCLVAVIGFLLGKVSASGARAASRSSDGTHQLLPDSDASNKRKAPKRRADAAGSVHDKRTANEHGELANDDPLLERANDAIELLRTLNSCASDNSTSYSALLDSSGAEDADAAHKDSPQHQLLAPSGAQRQLASLSGRSSASSSTGYNSDSHSRRRTGQAPSPAVVEQATKSLELLDERGEPTTIRLVLDGGARSWTSFSLRRAAGGQLEMRPVASEPDAAGQSDEQAHYARPASARSQASDAQRT